MRKLAIIVVVAVVGMYLYKAKESADFAIQVVHSIQKANRNAMGDPTIFDMHEKLKQCQQFGWNNCTWI